MAEIELSKIPDAIKSRLGDLDSSLIENLEIEVRQVMNGHQITLRRDGKVLSQCIATDSQLTVENFDKVVEKLIPK